MGLKQPEKKALIKKRIVSDVVCVFGCKLFSMRNSSRLRNKDVTNGQGKERPIKIEELISVTDSVGLTNAKDFVP